MVRILPYFRGLALAFFAVLVFSVGPAVAADDPTPEPSPSAPADPTPTPEPSPTLVPLEPGLDQGDGGEVVTSEAPTVVSLDEAQFDVLMWGGAFLLLFVSAHVVAEWRHGRD